MNSNINICPVCGSDFDNGVCRKCGYVRIIFPEIVSDSIKEMEQTRIKAAKSLLSGIDNAKETAQSCQKHAQSEIARLNDTIAARESSLKRSNERIDNLTSEIRKLQDNERKSVKQLRENQEKISEITNSVNRLKDTNQQLEHQLVNANREIQELQKRQIKTNAFLIVDDNGELSVLPVGTERTYYATGPGMDLCPVSEPQIRMLPMLTSQKIAFSIERSDTGAYRLTDLAGTLRSTGASKDNKMRLTQGVSVSVPGCSFTFHFCIDQK